MARRLRDMRVAQCVMRYAAARYATPPHDYAMLMSDGATARVMLQTFRYYFYARRCRRCHAAIYGYGLFLPALVFDYDITLTPDMLMPLRYMP